ncbi:uncharacterized protein [Diadema antillarum]|uniref:uncharacterized protein n=1 Tax=Diadema antillarum TaxID=105358 RepID=UPI003A85E37B
MFGWKKKKKEANNKSGSSPSGFPSLNNLLKGGPRAKKSNKNGKTDVYVDGQTSGSSSPLSTATGSPASFIRNGPASRSPSMESGRITSTYVHSLPPPEYTEHIPPDHSSLQPLSSTPNHPTLRATYTPPPGYGVLKQVSRPNSAVSRSSSIPVTSFRDGEEYVDLAGKAANSTPGRQDRSGYASKAIEVWSEEEVLKWLNDSDLEYFADLFDGCDIDGDYLSQLTEDDLIDLEVEEASLRQRLLKEIANIKEQKPTSPNQQAVDSEGDNSSSVHFGDTSDDDLFPDSPKSPTLSPTPKQHPPPSAAGASPSTKPMEEREKNQKKDDRVEAQRGRKDSDLMSVLSGASVVSSESRSGSGSGADGLGVPLPPERRNGRKFKSPPVDTSSKPVVVPQDNLPFSKKKVAQWNERDIIHWLDSIHLGHLAQVFLDHRISGKELADIDMTLLDEMEIDSSSEREKLLSTLYDLTNPPSTTAREDVMSVISNASGYERQKYMAAVSILHSDDPDDVHFLPPEDRDSLLSSPEKMDGRIDEGEKEEEKDDSKKERVKEETPDYRVKMISKDEEEDSDSDDDWEDDDDDDEDEDDDFVIQAILGMDEKKGQNQKTAPAVKKETESGKAKQMPEPSKESNTRKRSSEIDSDFDFDDSDDSDDDEDEEGEEEGEAKVFEETQQVEIVKTAIKHTAESNPNITDDAKNKSKAATQDPKPAPFTKQGSRDNMDDKMSSKTNNKVSKQSSVESSDGSSSKAVGGARGVAITTQDAVGGTKNSSTRKNSTSAKMEDTIGDLQRQDKKASRTESSRSSGSEKEEKKKKGGLHKLKEAISPSNWKKSPRDSSTVQVWTDVGHSSGSGSKNLIIRLEEESTTQSLIELCLNQLDLAEDPRLYRLLQAPSHGKNKGNDRELDLDECPLAVQRGWTDPGSTRFEFRHRTGQGGAIKIVLRLPSQQPKGKLVHISLSTPAIEVVRLALRKFSMKNADPGLFCLLEVDKDGDVSDVADEAIPLQLDSHAFVLCDRSNRELHWTTQEEEEANAREPKVKRQDSLTSRASSRMSSISIGSSFGSSELLSSTRIDNEKLSKLELEMASIEESLVPAKDVPKPVEPVANVSISHIPEIKVNNEVYNSETHDISKELEEKNKELRALQDALVDLGNSYSQKNIDARLQTLEQRLASCPVTDSLPAQLTELLAALEAASVAVDERQREVEEMRQEIEELGGGLGDSASTGYDLTLAEVALLKAQYDHSSLLASMETAVADYQLQAQKVDDAKKKAAMSPRGVPSFYNSMPLHQQFSLLALQANAGSQGFHFQLAERGPKGGVYIQGCMPAGVMRVGDRLVEVNGHSVLASSILEVNTLLNRSRKAQLVLMREGSSDHMGTEVDRLTMQLATASEHYEACWQENKRLSETVQRLRPLQHQVLELSQQKTTMQQLHQKIEALEARNQAISEELRMAHEGNVNQSNQAISRLQGDKERLEAKVWQQDQKLKKLEAALAQKNAEITTLSQEKDQIQSKQKVIDLNLNAKVKAVDLIANADNDTPLWEVLKPAEKDEILHVLQEELEESSRQKQYLDQLYTLMLERAPELLEHLEQDFEASELSGSEEFC